MKPFNRERFLFYLLGAVLAVNAVFFGFGLFSCSRSDDPSKTCPDIGARFDNYSEKALAAVLGLIAGAGAFTLARQPSDDRDDASASPLPQRPEQPPEPSVSPAPQAKTFESRGRGKLPKDQ